MDLHSIVLYAKDRRHGTGKFITNERPEFEGTFKDLIQISTTQPLE